MAEITLKSISKKFRQSGNTRDNPGDFSMENLDLHIPDGKTTVILGPSGCGKSTLLRLIAGLIPPDQGEIYYNDTLIKKIAVKDRKIGMVFQDYALYPHLESKQNILTYFMFRKKDRHMAEKEKKIYKRTSDLMGVDINLLLHKKPDKLSGGQKQRVAIARCITREPELFLMDEPFSNLDQMLRDKYRIDLKKLLRELSITTVYVTHDQQEAIIMADQLVVMNTGRIEQTGNYLDIYNNPASIFAAEFLNPKPNRPAINIVPGNWLYDDYQGFVIGIRPEDIMVSRQKKDGFLSAYIEYCDHLPIYKTSILGLQIENQKILAEHPLDESLSGLNEIYVSILKYHLFMEEDGTLVKTVTL